MKLNRNTLCPHRLPSGHIRNISRTVDGIKLKISECVEADVEETKDAMRILPLMLLQLLLLCNLRVLM